MADGYTVLEYGTLASSSTTDITFSNIPQTFSHLEFTFSGISMMVQNRAFVYLKINDDTSSVYSRIGWLLENGLNRDVQSWAGPMNIASIQGTTAQANQAGVMKFDFVNYSSTVLQKTGFALSTSTDASASGNMVGKQNAWSYGSTNAITKINFNVSSGFKAGSTYSLGAWK